ncbi:hypothetical protein [Brevibacillus dissolubilis]|uniref:hypothetical protein n=1 Tax=Brevibacillus dissolubilis TaxID=1844116 RepID=UPI0021002EBD|nr:hypothetical protein [Brevibacillus dissolubilis]
MKVFSIEIVSQSIEQMQALDQVGVDVQRRLARQTGENQFVVPAIAGGGSGGAAAASRIRNPCDEGSE